MTRIAAFHTHYGMLSCRAPVFFWLAVCSVLTCRPRVVGRDTPSYFLFQRRPTCSDRWSRTPQITFDRCAHQCASFPAPTRQPSLPTLFFHRYTRHGRDQLQRAMALSRADLPVKSPLDPCSPIPERFDSFVTIWSPFYVCAGHPTTYDARHPRRGVSSK